MTATDKTTTSNTYYVQSFLFQTKEEIVAELLEKKAITTTQAVTLLQKDYVYVPQYPLATPQYPHIPGYPTITYANNSNAAN